MKKSTQYGKGLAGFFFGLILATGIIAGILFFLNQGNQNVFKELTQPKQSEEPEILKPQDKAEKRPTTDTSSTQADEEKAKAEKEAADKTAKDKKAADQLTDKQKERAERKLAEKKAAEAKKQNKPTPEQILNSGSIEKARKAANASATKESSKQSAEKAEATANSGKKAFLQLGSFADRSSADSQRAKLAILGVSSKVVESQNGDKTIYRVQSNTMPQEAAVKLQKNLQGHNINGLIRSSK
ncbi:MAG: SPOR domain-containing protein [Neisseria sp.]|nr:SPOR domain-containing protein [Neisseria sp.]